MHKHSQLSDSTDVNFALCFSAVRASCVWCVSVFVVAGKENSGGVLPQTQVHTCVCVSVVMSVQCWQVCTISQCQRKSVVCPSTLSLAP